MLSTALKNIEKKINSFQINHKKVVLGALVNDHTCVEDTGYIIEFNDHNQIVVKIEKTYVQYGFVKIKRRISKILNEKIILKFLSKEELDELINFNNSCQKIFKDFSLHLRKTYKDRLAVNYNQENFQELLREEKRKVFYENRKNRLMDSDLTSAQKFIKSYFFKSILKRKKRIS